MVRMRTVRSSIRRLKRAKKTAKKIDTKRGEREKAHELAQQLVIGTLVRARLPLLVCPGTNGQYDVAIVCVESTAGAIGTNENPPVLMYLESKWLPVSSRAGAVQAKYHLFSLQGKTVAVWLGAVTTIN